jgi:hypothetical protein
MAEETIIVGRKMHFAFTLSKMVRKHSDKI